MSLVDKMALWIGKTDIAQPDVCGSDLFEGVVEDGDGDGDVEDGDGGGDDEADLPDLHAYRGAVINNPSYHRLISSLKREMSLGANVEAGGVGCRGIRDFILGRLPSGVISKRTVPLVHEMTFELCWDPMVSLCGRPLHGGASGAITLVSDSGSYFATRALEYMQRTWPCSGIHIVQLLDSLMGSHDGSARVSSGYFSFVFLFLFLLTAS